MFAVIKGIEKNSPPSKQQKKKLLSEPEYVQCNRHNSGKQMVIAKRLDLRDQKPRELLFSIFSFKKNLATVASYNEDLKQIT